MPLIAHFNDYVIEAPEQVSDLMMWSERGDLRSAIRPAGPVLPEEVAIGTFVFIGRLGPAEPTDYQLDAILARLDQLLPLYEIVMRRGLADAPTLSVGEPGMVGSPSIRTQTQAVWLARIVDIRLRHNEIACALYKQLHEAAGSDSVEFERPAASGGRFDARVRHADGTSTWYEIKTAASAGACIRQAVGQLLEYAYWSEGPRVRSLVVVGDVPLRSDEEAYLNRLRTLFNLPLDYLCVDPS